MYFIVSLRVYVCDDVRASVSGLLRPFLSFGFYPLNLHSFKQLIVNVNEKHSAFRGRRKLHTRKPDSGQNGEDWMVLYKSVTAEMVGP